MRDTQAETRAEGGEAGSLRGPDVGLDPRTPGSRPEPKADAPPLSHPVSHECPSNSLVPAPVISEAFYQVCV